VCLEKGPRSEAGSRSREEAKAGVVEVFRTITARVLDDEVSHRNPHFSCTRLQLSRAVRGFLRTSE